MYILSGVEPAAIKHGADDLRHDFIRDGGVGLHLVDDILIGLGDVLHLGGAGGPVTIKDHGQLGLRIPGDPFIQPFAVGVAGVQEAGQIGVVQFRHLFAVRCGDVNDVVGVGS